MRLQWFNNRLTIRTRLVLGFGLVGLTLVAAPLAMYMLQSSRALQSAGRKYIGIAPSKALLRMVQLLQQHRGLSSGVLGGSTTMEAQRAAKQTETDKAVETFDAIVASDIHDPSLTAAWSRAFEAWRGLANGVSSRSITGQASFAKHTAIIGDSLKLLDLMLDDFGLSYDPTGHDYHLTMA
ncbi:nitrate- and nitrite sensing domain-containing protein, partial [Candidatus Methylomirabilis sp.]|uniref:nitrate- and nitrite sensing domain-containing protein n=1 Tax=Candidatus Methylomirabilis sp. TaxID=2032687 RepID=UPI003C75DDA2